MDFDELEARKLLELRLRAVSLYRSSPLNGAKIHRERGGP